MSDDEQNNRRRARDNDLDEFAEPNGDDGSAGVNDEDSDYIDEEDGDLNVFDDDEEEEEDPTPEQKRFQEWMESELHDKWSRVNAALKQYVRSNPVPAVDASDGPGDVYSGPCLEAKRIMDEASFRYEMGKTGWLVGTGDNENLCLGLKVRGKINGTGGLVEVNRSLRGAGIRQIASGGISAFLSNKGVVYTSGMGDAGELGRDIPSDVTGEDNLLWKATPRPLQCGPPLHGFPQNGPSGVRQIACGQCHGLALTADGLVYMWGGYRDLDAEIFVPRASPTEESKGCNNYATLVPNLENVVQVYTGPGANFSYALTEDGRLYSWGFGNLGELARPIVDRHGYPLNSVDNKMPYVYCDQDQKMFYEDVLRQFLRSAVVQFPAPFPQRAEVLSVACGAVSVLVVARDPAARWGTVFSAGANSCGQLGVGHAADPIDLVRNPRLEPYRYELREVEALKHLNMGKVAAGDFHCLALTFDMEGLYAWGRSCEGQLGLGSDPQYTKSRANVPTPTRVVFYDRTSTLLVTDIACGQFHSMAKSADGDVYTWGFADGKVFLGTGHRAPETRNIYIPIKLEMRVKDIDEELESIQMVGGNNISLFLVQGRADPPE